MESNLSGSGLNNHAVIRLGLLGLSSADPREFGEDNVAVGLLLHSGLLSRLFYSGSAALKVLSMEPGAGIAAAFGAATIWFYQ